MRQPKHSILYLLSLRFLLDTEKNPVMTSFFSKATSVAYALFFLCFFPQVAFASNPETANCDHPDFSALEALYQSTDGDNWDSSHGWFENCEPCSWPGIRCNSDDRIIVLVLRNKGLTGTLPAELSQLEFLSSLSLPGNNLFGEIPSSLASLTNLYDLYLTDNHLTGNIPAVLLSKGRLVNLHLDRNDLSGELPVELSKLINIRRLYLSGNNFTGQIPSGLADFPNLTFMNVENNSLSGCLPADLVSLCDASKYRFSENPGLPLNGEFRDFCETAPVNQTGVPCDDLDAATLNDQINSDCGCGAVTGLVAPNETGLDALNNLQVDNDEELVDIAPSFRMSFFPNPANTASALTVNLPDNEEATLRLLSITGRTLLTISATGENTQLQLPELEPGLYLLEATSAERKTVKRVMLR